MNELIDLNFAPGIRADDVNKNFSLIHDWLRRERLRTAGWGLVEGFSMSADLKAFTITVEDGIMINKNGEEVIVPKKTFTVGPPKTVKVEETVVGTDDGVIELKYRPYSVSSSGYFIYNPPGKPLYPDKSEFFIMDELSGMRVPILQIIDKKLFVNATDWAGRTLTLTYCTTEDRVDTILLSKDGKYKYEESISSTSPSHVELTDYDDFYLVGVVYWDIDESINVQFFDNHRTYRKVYVDNQNRLYLNGKLYKEAQIIYFVEPKDPVINDLWYDHETNMLMIWKEKDGDFGWVVINDCSTVPLREHKIWNPADFPADSQTFKFAEDEINLRYVPGTNSLEVIIDNAPLMSDQFEEIVLPNDKEYLSDGIGFKLKEPLDRPTYVEVIVHQPVRNKPLRETFQRAAIFVAENHTYFNTLNTAQVFETITPYVIGEDQLEIFIDGKRLTTEVDFVEMLTDTVAASATDRKKMTKKFKVLTPLTSGQLVTHKISKHVWSYDHLDMMMHEIEAKAKQGLAECAQLRNDLAELNKNLTDQVNGVANQFGAMKASFGSPNDYVKKTDKIAVSSVPSDVMNNLVSDQISGTFPTTGAIMLGNTKPNDFIIVNYISPDMSRMLIKGAEYSLTAVGNDTRVDLQASLVSSNANISIVGFKIGR